MKMSKVLFSALLAVSLFFVGCKPKDADVQANVQEKLKTNAEMTSPLTTKTVSKIKRVVMHTCWKNGS